VISCGTLTTVDSSGTVAAGPIEVSWVDPDSAVHYPCPPGCIAAV